MPTKRLQMAEAAAGTFYEPLFEAILNENLAGIAAKEEAVRLPAQWASHQRIAKIDRLVAKAVSFSLSSQDSRDRG